MEPVGDKVLLSAVTARPGKDNRHSLELQGSIKVRGRLDKKRLLQSILGKDVASARIMLASFPELGRYELRMPKSMKTLPGWEPKIRVILREQP